MFSKKTAVAAAALLAAFAAQAQSQVNLYGNVDLSVGRFQQSGEQGVTALESSVMTDSFIGFKGTEDLGAGLKASFRLESFLAADTGSAAAPFWGRNANIGLAGGFGAVTLGRTQTIFFDSVTAYNPFGVSALSPTRLLTTGLLGLVAEDVPAGTTADRTWNNAITYTSPNLSGLVIAAQYGVKEADGNGANFGLTGNYVAGPLAVGAAYQNVKTGLNVGVKDARYALNGSYDFGVVKGFAQYGEDKVSSAAGSVKAKFYQLGASAPVTAEGKVLASVGQAKVTVDGDSGKETIFSLGYDHSLSKRTGAYVVYSNDKITDEKRGNTFAVGVRHAF
jgi:predicted porin